jgi:hypothetical protein
MKQIPHCVRDDNRDGNPLALGDDHLLPVRDDNPRWRFGPGVVMGDGFPLPCFS